MGSKCWFVLKQSHYPPPSIPENGIGIVAGTGVLCLGHIIPHPRSLDAVINRTGPLSIPRDMPIYSTKCNDFTWNNEGKTGVDISLQIDVPIPAVPGLKFSFNPRIAFQHSVENYAEFSSLDTFLLQPTSEYIEDSVEDKEVQNYFNGRNVIQSSTIYMITGIKVARGVSNVKASRQSEQGISLL